MKKINRLAFLLIIFLWGCKEDPCDYLNVDEYPEVEGNIICNKVVCQNDTMVFYDECY